MSKEFWEYDREDLRFEEEGEPHWDGNLHACMAIHQEPCKSTASNSLICPDTGKVTSYNLDDLRATLKQFRGDREVSSSRTTPEPKQYLASVNSEFVAVDDELHGPDGEWLVVTEVTQDKHVFTLQCLLSGARLRMTERAQREYVYTERLKVHRFGDPDIPSEFE